MIFYKRAANKEVEYYRKSEADELGLNYIPWRDAIEGGQWILTDDNYVIKTTRVKLLPEIKKNRKTRYRRRIYTELCWRYPHSRIPMEIEKHMEVCRYSIVPAPWWKEYQGECPALNKLLVKAILLGEIPFNTFKKYTREEIKVFDRIANKLSDHMNGNNIRKYYNIDEVRMQLQEEIKQMAIKKGCTLEEVFDLYAEAKTISRKKGDAKGLVMVGDRYAGIIGMTSKLVTTNQPPQLPVTDDVSFTKILDDNDNG
jgi:hypothetical protein